MHMPGHKGQPILGPEAIDLTEIEGADELYHTRGIIRESEENAAKLFDTAGTLYSAEGSSLCIRAMLYLALLSAREKKKPCRLLAGRNAHKALMTTAALLDIEIDWLLPGAGEDLLGCTITPEMLEKKLKEQSYMAVWLTSPDYLGRRANIHAAAKVCRRQGIPLLVDNAHGAYLKFLEPDEHPITLGADACCDSAHKTLSCLTGAAYLHISEHAPERWAEQAEQAMALFASSSPSWLILQSLDRMNRELAEDYPVRLRKAIRKTAEMKKALADEGWVTVGDEPMKLTLNTSAVGYTGMEMAELMRRDGIECEFSDRKHLVMMPSAETTEKEWQRLTSVMRKIQRREPLSVCAPSVPAPVRVMSIREAMLSPSGEIPVEKAVGEVMADAAAGCPPAVPVVVAGERITEEAAICMKYYGIDRCRVVRFP
jgi:arginine/lysine/ornithine decarboxylase